MLNFLQDFVYNSMEISCLWFVLQCWKSICGFPYFLMINICFLEWVCEWNELLCLVLDGGLFEARGTQYRCRRVVLLRKKERKFRKFEEEVGNSAPKESGQWASLL